jgi:hypothetical protein
MREQMMLLLNWALVNAPGPCTIAMYRDLTGRQKIRSRLWGQTTIRFIMQLEKSHHFIVEKRILRDEHTSKYSLSKRDESLERRPSYTISGAPAMPQRRSSNTS